jgi:hypothetical protein
MYYNSSDNNVIFRFQIYDTACYPPLVIEATDIVGNGSFKHHNRNNSVGDKNRAYSLLVAHLR